MKKLPDNSVDSIVTDPPYGLKFMGKKWDYEIPSVEIWQEAIRVLKPGGHLLSFGGSRTYHRMAVAIEDAGFEIRDQIMWVYGSGFPKSLNIGKSVDKLQGNEREEQDERGGAIQKGSVAWSGNDRSGGKGSGFKEKFVDTKGSSPYEGWGTALKPSHEPICMARKPLSESTIAENVLKWGTGGINIDGSRVEVDDSEKESFAKEWDREQSQSAEKGGVAMNKGLMARDLNEFRPQGRFPANFIHDGSDEVVGLFPDSKSVQGKNVSRKELPNIAMSGKNYERFNEVEGYTDSGSASRFFKTCPYEEGEGASFTYQAKASKRDRDGSTHPTMKPTKLMQYLVRMFTPKGGICLDPFMGSGSTGKACKIEGFDFIGIELDAEYCKIAEARMANIQEILL